MNNEYTCDIIIKHSVFLCCDKITETKMTDLPVFLKQVFHMDCMGTFKLVFSVTKKCFTFRK